MSTKSSRAPSLTLVTLLETLEQSRRVTWTNAAQWGSELALTVHHAHCKYYILSLSDIADIVLLPDLAICTMARSVLNRAVMRFQDPLKREFLLKAGTQRIMPCMRDKMKRMRKAVAIETRG